MNRRGIFLLGVLVLLALSTFSVGTLLRANANNVDLASRQSSSGALSGGGSSNCVNPDARINPVCTEQQQSVAIYCTEGGGIKLIPVVGGVGVQPTYQITGAQVNAVVASSQNKLIKQFGGIKLYRLSDGRLEIVSPSPTGDKPYIFIWKSC
jgi:hypothetical protein